MILGALIGALGYGLLHRLEDQSTFIDMLPGFVLIPAGIGLAAPAMTTAIFSSVDPASSGAADTASFVGRGSVAL
jgi:MFS transporter, DHA2 family, methylenomycin A resistance protein